MVSSAYHAIRKKREEKKKVKQEKKILIENIIVGSGKKIQNRQTLSKWRPSIHDDTGDRHAKGSESGENLQTGKLVSLN